MHAHHGHDHAHPTSYGRAFVIGITLNLGFVFIEGLYGFLADSMALLSDAGHNLSDVLGLVLAWGATLLAKRQRSDRFTYGLRSSSILAALFNALLLLVAVGGIAWESVRRLIEPAPVAEVTVMVVAAIGILVNGFTAMLFMRGGAHDINIRGAFLHMAADALVSAVVVVAGFLILWTGMTFIDPVVSLLIGAVIVWGTWDLLRQSLTLSLQGVPSSIVVKDVQQALEAIPGAIRVHHLHVWAMSTTETALTCHIVMREDHSANALLLDAQRMLKSRFAIGHPTIQIETGHAQSPTDCTLGHEEYEHGGPAHDHRDHHDHDHHDHAHGGHDHAGKPHARDGHSPVQQGSRPAPT